MNGPALRRSLLDQALAETRADEHTKALFDYFADQVDADMQNTLTAELMARYAALSRQLEEKNRTLALYNNHLEELVREKVREVSASQVATLHALIKSAEARDDETGAHIERTSAFCRLLAELLRKEGAYPDTVDDAFVEGIEAASPLHDIGKVGIRDAILLKPGRLTSDEFEVMKTHVLIGYRTLASVARLHPENKVLALGMEISRDHHEKWNGSGYMRGLSGERIPLSARVMALSDVYDALRSRRVYKDPYPHEYTLDIIAEGRGKHFDPLLTDLFLENGFAFRDIFDRLTAEELAASALN